MNTLRSLCDELQLESSAPIFMKIQQYAALAASTAIAMQREKTSPEIRPDTSSKELED
jgi:hypothetical protein